MDRAQHLSARIAWAAAFPQITGGAVGLPRSVFVDAIGGRPGLGGAPFLPVAAKLLAAGAGVAVGLVIIDEVRAPEAAVGAVLLEHRNVRLDTALVDQPREVGRISIAGVGGQPRSEEHTSELQSLMRRSYAVFCL